MGQKLPKIAHIFLGKTKIENPAPCCDVGWVHLGGTAVRILGAKRAGRKQKTHLCIYGENDSKL